MKKFTDDPNYRFTLEPIPLLIASLIATGIFLLAVWSLEAIAAWMVSENMAAEFLLCGVLLFLLLRFGKWKRIKTNFMNYEQDST